MRELTCSLQLNAGQHALGTRFNLLDHKTKKKKFVICSSSTYIRTSKGDFQEIFTYTLLAKGASYFSNYMYLSFVISFKIKSQNSNILYLGAEFLGQLSVGHQCDQVQDQKQEPMQKTAALAHNHHPMFSGVLLQFHILLLPVKIPYILIHQEKKTIITPKMMCKVLYISQFPYFATLPQYRIS